MSNIFTSVILTLFFTSIIVSLPVQYKIIQILKNNHPNLYIQLGSPQFITFGEKYASSSYWGFMLKRKHRQVGDSRLSRLFDTLLILTIICITTLIIAFVSD
jgi:hypothetical protein